MKNSLYHNASGCYDPTAGEAMSNIIRDERRERKKHPPQAKENQPKQAEKTDVEIKRVEETEVDADEDNGI